MSFDVNWDIEKYREEHESDDHWLLRRNFMDKWKTAYPEDRLVCLARVFANIEFMGCRYPQEVMQEVARMSKEVNKNITYNQPGILPFPSNNESCRWRCYSRGEGMEWIENGHVNPYPPFSADIQPNVVNSIDTNQSTLLDNNSLARMPVSHQNSTNSIKDTSVAVGKEGFLWEQFSKDAMQGPVSVSKVLRTAYAESFRPSKSMQQLNSQRQTREGDSTLSNYVNSIPNQSLSQNNAVYSNGSSNQSFRQNQINPSVNLSSKPSFKVVPFGVVKGKQENPADPRLILYPQEPTFSVKMNGRTRIAKQVIRICYRKSLKNTLVYTKGPKSGVCKRSLGEVKRKRALWWVAKGKSVEEALLLCLRPFHEIYDEITEGKHSWATPTAVMHLLQQINKQGVYNPSMGRPQEHEADSSEDDSKSVHSEDNPSQSTPSSTNPSLIQTMSNLGKTSMTLQTQETHPVQEYHQNSEYHQVPCEFPVNPSVNYSERKEAIPSLMSIEVNPNSIYANIKMTGAARRRYHYWLYVGKTHAEASRLCHTHMSCIPMYKKLKATIGSVKSIAKSFKTYITKQALKPKVTVRQTKLAHTMNEVDDSKNTINVRKETPSFPNINLNTNLDDKNSEGPESSFNTNKTNNSKVESKSDITQLETQRFLNEVININKSDPRLSSKIVDPESIDKFRWWRHLGYTVEEAHKMCLKPFRKFKTEHKEGSKKICFKTYIYESNNLITSTPVQCPKDLKGKLKIRFNYWIKMGKTKQEALLLCKHLSYKDVMKLKREQLEELKQRNFQRMINTENNDRTNPYTQIPSKTLEKHCTEKNEVIDLTDDDNLETDSKKTQDNIRSEKESDLNETEVIRFDWWKKQGKTEEEARILCRRALLVSEALCKISEDCEASSNKLIEDTASEARSGINQRLIEISKNSVVTSAITTANMPQSVLTSNIKQKSWPSKAEAPNSQKSHSHAVENNSKIHNDINNDIGHYTVYLKANKDIYKPELEAIKDCLKYNICPGRNINITDVWHKNNHIFITCQGEYTKNSLEKEIPRLVPWNGAILSIVNADEVPKIMTRFFVPLDQDSLLKPARIKELLHEMNPDVGCDRWVFHNALPHKGGFLIIANIDPLSKYAKVLKPNKLRKPNSLKWLDGHTIWVHMHDEDKCNSNPEYVVRAKLFLPNVEEFSFSQSATSSIISGLHQLNLSVGCDRWNLIRKKNHPDGVLILVDMDKASRIALSNNNFTLKWYSSNNIKVTIIPIYVNVDLPVELDELRQIPQEVLSETLLGKLHFFNKSLGCLHWSIVIIQEVINGWQLTLKLSEKMYQNLVKQNCTIKWFGGQLLNVRLAKNITELGILEPEGGVKDSKLATAEPKKNLIIQVENRPYVDNKDGDTFLDENESDDDFAARINNFTVCVKANVDIHKTELESISSCLKESIGHEESINIEDVWEKCNHVIISCQNEHTRDWLDKEIPTLVPWNGAQLSIVNDDEIPYIKIRFFVPVHKDMESGCAFTPGRLKQLLHEQNPDTGCDRWIIHKSMPQTHQSGSLVIARIDKKSKNVLDLKQNNLNWFNDNIKITIWNKDQSRTTDVSNNTVVENNMYMVPELVLCPYYVNKKPTITDQYENTENWTKPEQKLHFHSSLPSTTFTANPPDSKLGMDVSINNTLFQPENPALSFPRHDNTAWSTDEPFVDTIMHRSNPEELRNIPENDRETSNHYDRSDAQPEMLINSGNDWNIPQHTQYSPLNYRDDRDCYREDDAGHTRNETPSIYYGSNVSDEYHQRFDRHDENDDIKYHRNQSYGYKDDVENYQERDSCNLDSQEYNRNDYQHKISRDNRHDYNECGQNCSQKRKEDTRGDWSGNQEHSYREKRPGNLKEREHSSGSCERRESYHGREEWHKRNDRKYEGGDNYDRKGYDSKERNYREHHSPRHYQERNAHVSHWGKSNSSDEDRNHRLRTDHRADFNVDREYTRKIRRSPNRRRSNDRLNDKLRRLADYRVDMSDRGVDEYQYTQPSSSRRYPTANKRHGPDPDPQRNRKRRR